MPNTEKVSSNWNSYTTEGGEIGTTTMENYLAVTTKAPQMYVCMTQQFLSQVFSQQKDIYMLTKRHVQECSKQHYSKQP